MSDIQSIENPKNTIEINGLMYSINDDEKTANLIDGISLFGNNEGFVIIPRFIIYESKEYIVTSISDSAFFGSRKIISIDFPPDSELKTIGHNAFSCSLIEELTIPSSLIELKKGWCSKTYKLTKIKISPKNDHFIYLKGQFIIEKSDQNNDDFDVLVFARRDIQSADIPDFITEIKPFAFNDCRLIQTVNFSENSKLHKIGKYSFSQSSIQKVSIPSKVTEICKKSFEFCKKLSKIEIPKNSELEIIGKNAFMQTQIDEIFIPSHVTQIGENAFSNCRQLEKVEFQENSELKKIGKFAFYLTQIVKIKIPPSLIQISESAFSFCTKLKEIEIPENSELQTIENGAFVCTVIESISIPSKLIDLKEGWCSNMNKLNKINVSIENPRYKNYENKFLIGKSKIEQENFDVLEFCVKNIENVIIPSFIKYIAPFSFNKCTNISQIQFEENSQLEIFGFFSFYKSSIENISIPSHVTKICESTFGFCHKLKKIEFSIDSHLQKIEDEAFYDSNIDRIFIPNSVTEIGNHAFYFCNWLKFVNFQKNSQLQRVGDEAFKISSIHSIFFPSHLVHIGQHAFGNNLQIIEIDENSELDFNCLNSLIKDKEVICMVPVKFDMFLK